MTIRRFSGLLLLTLLFCGLAVAQSPFHLKQGDRVVFYGDSITDQRLYTTFVETFVLTRFPSMKVDFIHSGWGGDRVDGGGGGPIDLRLERDVFAYNPTVVTIMLGMNDGRYRAFDQSIFDEYSKGLRNIVQTIKRRTNQGARITLIQPSPYDDVTRKPMFEGGYNSVLLRFGTSIKELAQTEGAGLADLNSPVVAVLQKAKSIDAQGAERLIADRVHPGAGGHLIMAEALLKSWNAPAIVTDVEIDGARYIAARAENTKVYSVWGNGSSLGWNQVDAALPMPLDSNDKALALAVRSSDFNEALNRQPLKVTGLKAGKWRLRIDADDVGTFTKEELEKGIDLAVMRTPMARQAAKVHALTRKHNDVHFWRWRNVQLGFDEQPLPEVAQAAQSLDRLEYALIAAQRDAAQPKPHRYELVSE